MNSSDLKDHHDNEAKEKHQKLVRCSSIGSERSQISHSKSFFEKERDKGENVFSMKLIDFPIKEDLKDVSIEERCKRQINKVPTNQKDTNLLNKISQKSTTNNIESAKEFETAPMQPSSTRSLLQNVKNEKEARHKIIWEEEGPSIEVR